MQHLVPFLRELYCIHNLNTVQSTLHPGFGAMGTSATTPLHCGRMPAQQGYVALAQIVVECRDGWIKDLGS